jgi:hypothetical protein
MTLTTSEFIRRFLIHVLPRGQHRIRHYGFYGNGSRAANIATIRKLLSVKAPSADQSNDDLAGSTDDQPRTLAIPCPCCGGRLVIVNAFDPLQHARAPPSAWRPAHDTCARYIARWHPNRRPDGVRPSSPEQIYNTAAPKGLEPVGNSANRWKSTENPAKPKCASLAAACHPAKCEAGAPLKSS